MPLHIVRLRKNITYIKPSNNETIDVIEEIKNYIADESCQNVILDLSDFTFLKALRVGVISATYHFVEFMSGVIYLVVQDKQAKQSIETLNLSNAVVVYNQSQLYLDNIA